MRGAGLRAGVVCRHYGGVCGAAAISRSLREVAERREAGGGCVRRSWVRGSRPVGGRDVGDAVPYGVYAVRGVI